MSPNPFASLLHSRKFWLLILDTIISITLYFIGRYSNPEMAEDMKFLIASLQPIFVAVIIGIFAEDNAQIKANITPPLEKGVMMDASIGASNQKPRTFLFVMYEVAGKLPTIKETAAVVTMSPPKGERWFWISVPVGISTQPLLPTITELH